MKFLFYSELKRSAGELGKFALAIRFAQVEKEAERNDKDNYGSRERDLLNL